MKKYIAIMMALAALLMLMTACGGDPETPSVDQPQSGESSGEFFVWDETEIEGLTELGKKQTSLTIPENCTEIDRLEEGAFERITFENPDTKIEDFAFDNCEQLKSIELPANMEIISWGTFTGCTGLEEIVVPDSVKEIDDEAFYGCVSLKKVTFGSGLQVLCRGAFDGCTALESASLPDSLVTIEKGAFKGCAALKDVSFGNAVETIGESAFEGCTALEVVKVPESVKSIERYAFAFCDALKEVHLPSGLETLDNTALAQTHNFKLYLVSGSLADQMFGDMMGNEYMEKNYQ